MAAETVDCVHSGVVPIPIHVQAILEGRVELLGGACERCGQTVIGVYTNSRLPVEWIPVSKIVRKVRHYRRQEVVNQFLGTPSQSVESGS
ncbi:hypothetical protein [Fodinicola acaciae]|uniref:hypothetical protein n=1 Tax=Fodinicola acaciae TaxID=2681555 RepID=UPI0013D0D199|nr:hypothetical protein [Fodinicola acaciae]